MGGELAQSDGFVGAQRNRDGPPQVIAKLFRTMRPGMIAPAEQYVIEGCCPGTYKFNEAELKSLAYTLIRGNKFQENSNFSLNVRVRKSGTL